MSTLAYTHLDVFQSDRMGIALRSLSVKILDCHT